MKQLACPSKPAVELLAGEEAAMFSSSTSPSKWVTEPAFEVGRSVASPSANTFGVGASGACAVGRDEAERVAEAGRALDIGGAAVQRDGDEQVEVELAPVVGVELAADAVDLAGVELGHELDLLLASRTRQVLGGDRLREAPSSGVA